MLLMSDIADREGFERHPPFACGDGWRGRVLSGRCAVQSGRLYFRMDLDVSILTEGRSRLIMRVLSLPPLAMDQAVTAASVVPP